MLLNHFTRGMCSCLEILRISDDGRFQRKKKEGGVRGTVGSLRRFPDQKKTNVQEVFKRREGFGEP
jgi:hypothetical protein